MKQNKFGQKTAIWAQLQENLMNIKAQVLYSSLSLWFFHHNYPVLHIDR